MNLSIPRAARIAPLLAVALLAGCASSGGKAPSSTPPVAASTPPPAALAAQIQPQPGPGEIGELPPAIEAQRSQARTLVEYQRHVAEHLHAANGERVYQGRPPNPVRAVIVYQAEIDVTGRPAAIRMLRSPGSKDLEARAVESLRRASPFPAPPVALLRDTGRVTLTETWLFDYQGRFRLRTLSLPQDPDAGL